MLEDTVDRESPQKLYVQIYSILRGKIEKGEWPGGTRIPAEDELCKAYTVSKATVRIAIAELVRDGYLRRQQGKGTFVMCSSPAIGMAMRTRLTEDMFGKRVKVEKEVVVQGVREPEEGIKSYLKAEDPLYYLLCVRTVDGEPACLDELFIPLALLPGVRNEDLYKASLYDLIQERAIRKIFKVIQTIEVTEIGGEAASILKVREGTAGLLLHRLLLGSDESPLAYTRLTGSGVKYKIQNEFERLR
ncbi:MAG: GntR family transcriptional regulator [Alphaproteobacteria bacterium]|uniref:GntR family transcriptional regulator n=1 Tax=Candidatus Nitrobium versatile TaxID=2884831 RepID=A0A953J5A0_9BACT|nr:GntR family transcriptional regulator [Candidatus Nitrobium versatile]